MKRFIQWQIAPLFAAFLLFALVVLLASFAQAETGNQAFIQLPSIRSSGVMDAVTDPNIAYSFTIKMPTGSMTAVTNSVNVRVPITANTATLTILGQTTPVGSVISSQIKGVTPDFIIQLKGKPAIVDATAIPLDCSNPSSATTDIFVTGKYEFPVEPGGEVIISASHVSNGSVANPFIRWGTDVASPPLTRFDLSFKP